MRCRAWCCAPHGFAAQWFKNWLVRGFLKLYTVDMTEAAESDPLRYGSFNEFFTRALKADARAIAPDLHAIACPADGVISEAGSIVGDTLLQAKGRGYTLGELLAARPWASRFEGGSFATIYLAPFNYHRVHLPLRGQLKETVYVPGRLFSVNAVTASHVPQLFARNERVLTLFDTAFGEFALILVGALNVGSIATVWSGRHHAGSEARGHACCRRSKSPWKKVRSSAASTWARP